MAKKLAEWFLGKEKDALAQVTKRQMALIAFIAWIGLGSDGLSSANYGPEEAFKALGSHPMLGVFLALMIGVTVFIIAGAYNQVVELFPNGGGGYKVANKLVHPIAGLISGVALIIDYILTIAISIASASDAIFSLLPYQYYHYNLIVKIILVCLLTYLNLRGMKESIKVLMPIFLAFVLTHFILIIYGIFAHSSDIHTVFSGAVQETYSLSHSIGSLAVLLILFKAYSLGGGTYTGLEAVSNNVNILAEPRVRTGKWTMFYMALSLSITAGGITFLYMLWQVKGIPGQTYNAILFGKMLGESTFAHIMLTFVLATEAGILILGANTGFLGGPAVLSNMSLDRWVPFQFSNLSSRMVRQNGILFFGLGAILILLATDGHVGFLVVLYSTSVFLTFSITIFGLSKYWWQHKKQQTQWFSKFMVASIGFIVCLSILVITMLEKFTSGGWLTIVVTIALVYAFWKIHDYYKKVEDQLENAWKVLRPHIVLHKEEATPPEMDPSKPTAVILLFKAKAISMHTLQSAIKLFRNRFHNVIFLHAGVVDVQSLGGPEELERLKTAIEKDLSFFTYYANSLGLAAKAYADYGTNPIDIFTKLSDEVTQEFSDCIFFSGKLVVPKFPYLSKVLNNSVATSVQNRLHTEGKQMVILPMQLTADGMK